MDIKTFELHESYDEAVEKFKLEHISEDNIKNRLIELNSKEFDELKGMNRAEIRRWLKQNRKKAKAKV